MEIIKKGFNYLYLLIRLFGGAYFLCCANAMAQVTSSNDSAVNSQPTSLLGGKYYAVVIGNADYTDPAGVWQPLKTPINDANAIANILAKQYGFAEVNLLTNVNRREILSSFAALKEKITENDLVLIYYAGHGHMDEDKYSYWVPVDAEGDDTGTFIHQQTIVAEIKRITKTAKHTLMIADSCFSGDLLRQSRGARGLSRNTDDQPINEIHEYYARLSRDKSVQVITAGGNEFVDDAYMNSGHSPFTYFLLASLEKNDQQFVTANQLAERVKPLVANNTYQTPRNGVLFGAGDEGGEFVFSNAVSLNLDIPKNELDLSVSSVIISNPGMSRKKIQPFYKNPWFWAGMFITGSAAAYYVTQDGSSDSNTTIIK